MHVFHFVVKIQEYGVIHGQYQRVFSRGPNNST